MIIESNEFPFQLPSTIEEEDRKTIEYNWMAYYEENKEKFEALDNEFKEREKELAKREKELMNAKNDFISIAREIEEKKLEYLQSLLQSPITRPILPILSKSSTPRKRKKDGEELSPEEEARNLETLLRKERYDVGGMIKRKIHGVENEVLKRYFVFKGIKVDFPSSKKEALEIIIKEINPWETSQI